MGKVPLGSQDAVGPSCDRSAMLIADYALIENHGSELLSRKPRSSADQKRFMMSTDPSTNESTWYHTDRRETLVFLVELCTGPVPTGSI